MSKIIVNEDELIEISNQELKKHEYYEEGMEIIGVPEGLSGSNLSGYSWKGPDALMSNIVSDVMHKVKLEYELKVTYK